MDAKQLNDARATLNAAVEELAHEQARYQFQYSTTRDDAMPYADTASINAWLTLQLADSTLPTVIDDVLTGSLTDAEREAYGRALLTQSSVDELTRTAIHRAVADYIATAVDAYLDAYEPSDSDLYAVYGRTPYDSDREALARSQNAAIRLERML